MTNLIERDIRWSCFEANSVVADCPWRQMIITPAVASLKFISWAQENKIVCQLKNEMKLVLTTKLSRYKDWYETTNFDAERINWNDRNFAVPMLFQIWNEFVLKIKLLLLLLASREARKKAALHCINATIRSLQKAPILRSNIYDFCHW